MFRKEHMGFRRVCLGLAAVEVVWFFSFLSALSLYLPPELSLLRSFISSHAVHNTWMYLEFMFIAFAVFNVATLHFFAGFTLFLDLRLLNECLFSEMLTLHEESLGMDHFNPASLTWQGESS